MEKKIVWSNTALLQLDNIHLYILKKLKSVTTANKVVESIYKSVTILKSQSEIFPLDIYKSFNKGNYRAFEIFSYRISYRVEYNTIFIVRIRHTKRDKLDY